MQDKTPYSELKAAIETLEKRRLASKLALQEEFRTTLDNLNPLSFLKNSVKNIAELPEVRNNLLSIIIPLITGFISKKAFGATRRQTLFTQAGILMIDGLNRYVLQNPEVINSISHYILKLFRKKKSVAGEEES